MGVGNVMHYQTLQQRQTHVALCGKMWSKWRGNELKRKVSRQADHSLSCGRWERCQRRARTLQLATGNYTSQSRNVIADCWLREGEPGCMQCHGPRARASRVSI